MRQSTHTHKFDSLITTPSDEGITCKYGEAVALSLIALAEREARYAHHLRRLIADVWPLSGSASIANSIYSVKVEYIEPLTYDIAYHHAERLMAN